MLFDWPYNMFLQFVLWFGCSTCPYIRLRDMDTVSCWHEAFHMKCQRQIARIRWQDHIRNTEVTTLTGLSPVSESVIRRCNSLFGHVTRLAEDTPAHQALWCHVDMTLGRFPDSSWRRRPGRPRNRWLDQLRWHGGLVLARRGLQRPPGS